MSFQYQEWSKPTQDMLTLILFFFLAFSLSPTVFTFSLSIPYERFIAYTLESRFHGCSTMTCFLSIEIKSSDRSIKPFTSGFVVTYSTRE